MQQQPQEPKKKGGARPGAGRPPKDSGPPSPFAEWCARSSLSKQEICERLKISKTALYAILSGEHRPSLNTAFDIEDLTGGEITARSFRDPAAD